MQNVNISRTAFENLCVTYLYEKTSALKDYKADEKMLIEITSDHISQLESEIVELINKEDVDLIDIVNTLEEYFMISNEIRYFVFFKLMDMDTYETMLLSAVIFILAGDWSTSVESCVKQVIKLWNNS